MELYDALLTTRAMRRYRDDPVTDDEVLTCLRAAQQAPTGGNVQPQQYVVVRDTAQRASVATLYRSAFDRYERSLPDPTFRTPEDEASWRRARDASRHLADHLEDSAGGRGVPAADHPVDAVRRRGADGHRPALRLRLPGGAELHGRGPVAGHRHGAHDRHPHPHAELCELLGVPAGYEVAALVPMGRPTGRFGVARRKPVEAVTHWDRFGTKRR